MRAAEIRLRFLDYFRRQGHEIVSSSALIPRADPSLLFTNAGMVQFKNVFLGEEHRPYARAASAQKCVRAGGKHNDLENVGRTARHHTFFEMLGNFSFGDYFKAEAIRLGWDFLTREMKLPAEKLYATVFKEDEEAYKLWHDTVGLPPERIVRLGEKDNFWSMGETGPCGPCSEILIDQGPEMSCGRPDCQVGCDCDRYLELWNLVFMQYNRDAAGKLTPLPRPSIDTGMGLERLAAVLQGVKTNFDTDLLRGIIRYVEELAGKEYGGNPDADVSFRVIADHSRAITFLIADGVLPSNEGRGYVLRRIMRRAARHAKLLGCDKPILYQVSGAVVDFMREAYPELNDKRSHIAQVVMHEEERFLATLDNGLKILSDEVSALKAQGQKVLPGDLVFRLYDTFGFPVDLTEDIVRQEGFTLDQAGFEAAMDVQREKARQAWKGSGAAEIDSIYRRIASGGSAVEFVGYETLSAASEVRAIIVRGELAESAGSGGEVEVVTSLTPFYGETGGQVGDQGTITANGLKITITDTLRPLPQLIVHRGRIESGTLTKGQEVTLSVDPEPRLATARHHSATHLLQAALRKVLGGHVNQAGSLVSPSRLRFDFSHFSSMTPQELRRVEEQVNRFIRANDGVNIDFMSMAEAMKQKATALFEEKYGDVVRVVSMGEYSTELCGGTHVSRVGDIGVFKLLSEGGIAAGVRRIEALAGQPALDFITGEEEELQKIAVELKSRPGELAERVEKLVKQVKKLEKEVEALKVKVATADLSMAKAQAAGESSSDATVNVREINGVKVLAQELKIDNPKSLREVGDKLRDQIKSGIVVLGSRLEGKALLLVIVTKDLTNKYHAGNLIKELVVELGGSGGGRPDMAQAGGPQPDNLPKALEKVYSLI